MKKILLLTFLVYPILAYSQSVTSEGSLSYSVPIAVPAGVHGLTPSLSLDYNSSGKNGVAGYGWSLSGIPTISRNTAYPLNYDGNDHFLHSNGKLVQLASGQYATEVDTLSRFQAYKKSDGKTIKYWIETLKDGTKRYYGYCNGYNGGDDSNYGNQYDANGKLTNSSEPYVQHPAKQNPYIWALSRVENVYGDHYDISYYVQDGLCYPKSITYAYTSGLLSSSCNMIEFTYAFDSTAYTDSNNKVVPKQLQKNYRYHTGVVLTGHITDINVSSKTYILGIIPWTDISREYDLAYADDHIRSLHFLKSISESCGGISRTLGTYHYDNENFWTKSVPAKEGDPDPFTYEVKNFTLPGAYGKLFYGDFNGDGMTDVLCIPTYRSSGKLYLSNGDGTFQSPLEVFGLNGCDNGQYLVGNFNGDSRDEIIMLPNSTQGYWLYGYQNGQFVSICHGNFPSFQNISTFATATIGDYDGDGKANLYIASNAGGTQEQLNNSGIWTFDISKNQFIKPYTNSISTSFSNSNGQGLNNTQAVDVNGYGKTDMLLSSDYTYIEKRLVLRQLLLLNHFGAGVLVEIHGINGLLRLRIVTFLQTTIIHLPIPAIILFRSWVILMGMVCVMFTSTWGKTLLIGHIYQKFNRAPTTIKIFLKRAGHIFQQGMAPVNHWLTRYPGGRVLILAFIINRH